MAPAPHDVLGVGEVEVLGRFAGSSNATLLVSCSLEDTVLRAVYKPERGERPLWDFPRGLWRREVAAYRLADRLGWPLVPLTVERRDAPFGVGSLQAFVDEDGESHYFTLRDRPDRRDDLIRIAALDVVMNNADRKSGHVLRAGQRIWAIDHGLCFHCEPKLRTVIWEFAGVDLPSRVLAALRQLCDLGIPDEVAEMLAPSEVSALWNRLTGLTAAGRLPAPDEDREWPPYPWPLV